MLSCFSSVRFFVTPWTVARQCPLSMGFSRQEYWSGLPCPPPGDLPNLGIEPTSLSLLHWQAGSLPLAPLGKHLLFAKTCHMRMISFYSLSPFSNQSQCAGHPHKRHVPLEPFLVVSFSFASLLGSYDTLDLHRIQFFFRWNYLMLPI